MQIILFSFCCVYYITRFVNQCAVINMFFRADWLVWCQWSHCPQIFLGILYSNPDQRAIGLPLLLWPYIGTISDVLPEWSFTFSKYKCIHLFVYHWPKRKIKKIKVNTRSADELKIHADRASVGVVFNLLPVEIWYFYFYSGLSYWGYPAKGALSAMPKHGG